MMDFDRVEEARRIAAAEVDRAFREFENGEDVRSPCYSSITDGRTTRHFNVEMRVIYPAGKPVIGTLSAKVVEEPATGRTRYFTNVLIPCEWVKLGAAAMRDRARHNAEYMARREPDANARIFTGCKTLPAWRYGTAAHAANLPASSPKRRRRIRGNSRRSCAIGI